MNKGRNEGYTKCNKEKSKGNNEEKEARVQISDLEYKEEIVNQTRMKKQEFKKTRRE